MAAHRGLSLALLTACALPGAASAEDGLKLSGSMRLRYEAIAGQQRPGFNRDDDLFNLRTTLRADYQRSAFHAVAEIYDSRVYGDDARTPITTGEDDALEPAQAYIGLTLPGTLGNRSTLTIDAGRMLLNIAGRRLVASDDYRNTTNSYTGVRAQFAAPGGWQGTLIYVLPQLRLPDDRDGLRHHRVRLDRESFDLVLWGGTVSRDRTLGPMAAEASFYHLAEHDQPGRTTRERALDTFGGRLFRDRAPGRLDVQIETFGQTGSLRTTPVAGAARQSVRAWFLHADVGYTFAGGWHPRLSLEYDQASGDRPGGAYNRFDTLFGSRRQEFAPAGLLTSIGRANLLAPGGRIEATPTKRVDWFAVYRPLWFDSRYDSFSTSGVRDASGRAGRFAGHMIDTRVRYWLVPAHWRVELDGTLIANGPGLRDAPNGPAAKTTRYLSLNLTASI